MKLNFTFLLILNFSLGFGQQKLIEKTVDLGGYHLQFYVFEGEGSPILFESGAGDDGSVWKALAKDVHEVTGTTVICYDRSGFGKSELNPHHTKDADFGIENGIKELEISLKKLGYFKNLILVSHSYGGFYSTLFTARNPEKVLYNVRVDANLAGQYTEAILQKAEQDNSIYELKEKHPERFYLGVNFAPTVRLMWQTAYPPSVPAIDLLSPIQRHHTDEEWQLLLKTHADFVHEEANRRGIIAHGSGHYIYKDNPGLVLNAIVKAYVSTLEKSEKKQEILANCLEKSMELFIQSKQN